MNKRSKDLYCLIAKCAEEFSTPRTKNSREPDLTIRMLRLAEKAWSLYDRENTGLDAVVPYYMHRFSVDCFQGYEQEETPAAAARVVQILIWRTGLLLGLMAAHCDTVPAANMDYAIRLICLLIPAESTSAPDPELFEKLILTV